MFECKSCPESNGGVPTKRYLTERRKIPNAPCVALGSREGRFREADVRCYCLHLRCRRQFVADPNSGRIAAFVAVRKCRDTKNRHAGDPVFLFTMSSPAPRQAAARVACRNAAASRL